MTNPYRPQFGLTLIELVLTVALVAVLAAVAVPSMTSFVQKRQVQLQANALSTTFATARIEALTRLRPVTVCWNDTALEILLQAFELNPRSIVAMVGDQELMQREYISAQVTATDDSFGSCVEFDTQGRLVPATTVHFALCRKVDNENMFAGVVTVLPSGRSQVNLDDSLQNPGLACPDIPTVTS